MSFFVINPSSKSYARVQRNPGESLSQLPGYTHLLQIGSAADLPTLSSSPVWRRVAQLQETVGTVSAYLFAKTGKTGTTNEDVAEVVDPQDSTKLAYLGVQQILAGRIPENAKTAMKFAFSLFAPIDDRRMLLEDVVAWLATSGRSRREGPNAAVNDVQGQFINLLWNDLAHPPTVDLRPEHRFRSVDGSFNNLTGFPQLGAAKQAYARSVKPMHPTSPEVAEPEDFFDAILRRPPGPEGFKRHPAGISSLFFGLANIIIHDLFWTNTGQGEPAQTEADQPAEQHKDGTSHPSRSTRGDQKPKNQWQNLASSYLSLDPLYGVDKAEQAKVRDQSKEQVGRGLLHNDTFASSRLLIMPPASTALLVLFSRNHNRVARKVLELNEQKKWNPNLNELSHDQRMKQDEEIFGTARLVNCGYYVSMVLHDYLQTILGIVQADSDWVLDPRVAIKSILGTTPKAMGNSVSIEFNILYRWHSCLSMKQTQWLEEKVSKVLPSRQWDDLDQGLFIKAANALKKELNAEDGSDPKTWKLSKFHGAYERDPATGKFRDEDIAKILKDATNDIAGAFGANHTPAVLRWIDCQGMRTARDVWKACTLNEFRHFLGLKAFETFQEWNSDPKVAKAMEDLVGHPSNIPLHPGLHGEEAKTPRLGAGLCPNYTISRAILSDAVALVRGDRFYTDSATADNMTDWGLKDCQPDSRAGSYGGMLQKLIIKNLPNQYAFNDVALLFPLMVPDQAYTILSNISPQKARNYSVNSKPHRSVGLKISVASHDGVLIHEISDTEDVQIERMGELFGSKNMRSNISQVYESLDTIITGNEWKTYQKFIAERIKQCSTRRNPMKGEQTFDVCRDVVNPLVSGWLAHIFGLVETGLHSQQLLLSALSDVYLYLTKSQMTFKARSAARVAASELAWQIKYHIEAASAPSSIVSLAKKGAAMLAVGASNILEHTIKSLSDQLLMGNIHRDCRKFYEELIIKQTSSQERLSSDELAADCLRAVATLAYTITHGTAHALDYLIPVASAKMGDNSHAAFELLQSLKDLNMLEGEDEASFEKAKFREKCFRYGLEATRLNHWKPQLKGLIMRPEQGGTKGRRHGKTDMHWSLSRDMSEYERLLDANGDCLRFYKHIISVVVKEVAKLPKVRKAPGRQGELSKIAIDGSISVMPTMHIRFDRPDSRVGN